MVNDDAKQTRKKKLNQFLLIGYEKVELKFPVCIKVAENQIYRYLHDGRFEMICQTKNTFSHTFGKLFYDWHDEEMNWLRILASRHTLITEKEFIDEFQRIMVDAYEKHIQGDPIEETSQTFTTEIPIEQSSSFLPRSDGNYQAPF